MVEYIGRLRPARAEGTELPRIPPYIAECIMKIATHTSHKPNFANYPFKDEMICDSIEICCRYIYNYDPSKYKNPFAYFTTCIMRAFIQRIKKEKIYLYKKHVATEVAEVTFARQDHDFGQYKSDINQGEWSQEQMLRFMEDFEENKRKRRRIKVEK